MKRKLKLYAEIAKTTKGDDGTLIVEGYASSGAEDSDKEVVTPEAMKAAIPEYMKFGAVREMHDPKKAAGTALEAEVQEDGRTKFVAHVVDPTAVLKVEAGVYKGFSIGASIPKGGRDTANKMKINAINLVEVSLVDRPANPEALIECFKAEANPEDEDDDNDDGDGLELKKGLYNVQSMLTALSYLRDCASNIAYEAKNGDHSEKMVAGIKECAASLGAFCQKYLGEELKLLSKVQIAEGEEALSKAKKDVDEAVAKATELEGKLAEWLKSNEDVAKEVGEIAKAAGIEATEGMHYRDLLVAMLQKHVKEKDELLTRAAVPKGSLFTVTKGQDIDNNAPEVVPIAKADGSTDDVATLVKAAQRTPVRVTM